ncbi:tetratricopeptide repeat protein [Polyangium sp. y55x31]|uniref:tetratricopeptide repeat protein n=1 Tax=Polyangium sp. y55x31 TaxID=3042688 RepID=UPI002482B01E|nr:tetratricopeptide repeat protein [Polyangium sp. y55x31]MDI1477406.1 tetratricopeptide repeat protein [Polyangium sp. y55x31]
MSRPDRKPRVPRAAGGSNVLRDRVKTAAIALFALACVAGGATWLASGCTGWDPSSPFERNAPVVDQALADLDAGRFESAEQALETYLGTGPCTDAGLGLPDAVRQKYNGSFDLGLVLFSVAEKYGRRFGEEEQGDGGPEEEQLAAMRSLEIDCALIVVRAIAEDPKVPIDLRARAHYLAGNLEFLRKKYEEAVRHYDDALALIPGLPEDAAADGIGRDAAWNRAIALRRIEDQKDAGQDADQDANQDAGQDGGDDASDGSDGDDGSDGSDGGDDGGNDAGEDGGDDGGKDAGDDGGGDGGDGDAGQDAGGQDGGQSPPPPPQPASPEPQPGQEDRILDRFEEAPTYQEQEAKMKAGTRRGRVMEDK